MEQAVRPCLQCDALVDEWRAYCPKCGASVIPGVQLVVGRPAASAPRVDEKVAESAFRVALAACAGLAALALVAAAWASVG